MSTQGCEVGGVMAVESPSISTDLPNSETKVQNGAKKKPGSSWLAGDRHVLPRNNLPVVVFALALGVFLVSNWSKSQMNLLFTKLGCVGPNDVRHHYCCTSD